MTKEGISSGILMDEKLHKIIDVKDVEPLSEDVFEFLVAQSKESPFLDFKEKIDVSRGSDFAKIVKDVLAFANNGGGFILLGVKENDYTDPTIKGSFILAGLPDYLKIEQAVIQEKINVYLPEPIEVKYAEYIRKINGKDKKFGLIYVPPSLYILKPQKDGEYKIGSKKTKAFSKDDVFTRRGTQSIIASNLEKKWINDRIKDRNYQLSILRGEADNVTEKLFSNLFEVKSVPQKIFIAYAKFDNHHEDRDCLKKTYPGKFLSPLKYMRYEDKIISFQDLSDLTNPLHNIILSDKIQSESTSSWLEDPDKERIIISLLNKEFIRYAVNLGLHFYRDRGPARLFFPSETVDSKTMEWNSRFKGKSKKIIVQKRWNTTVKKFVFVHVAIQASIIKINEVFFLRLNPTFIVTEDGVHVSKGLIEGAMITEKSYRMFNRAYLTNIFFWIDCLTLKNELEISKDFKIETEPITTTIDHGISWDMPSMEIKTFIEQYDSEVDSQFEEDAEELLGEGELTSEYV